MNSGGRAMHASDERQRVKWIGRAAFDTLVMPLCGSLMVAGWSTLAASTARAQAMTVSETDTANQEPGLTEIVVTARKRVETM